jgi:co-chaperonin GroES (HSP10)
MPLKLLGNTILAVPVDERTQQSPSGLIMVNHYKKPTLKFRVLAVGPGQWRKRVTRTGRTKTLKVWDAPQCLVGDLILCRAQLDHEIVKHNFDDGTGRVILHAADARGNPNLLLAWTEKPQ